MQIPDRRKLFQKRHHRREEIEAQLRRAQIEDQYSTEDSSSEDEESSEGDSEDEVVHEESSDGELEKAISENELEETDESQNEEDELEEEIVESEEEEYEPEEDEVELEEEEEEEEDVSNEEECNMSLSKNSLTNGSSSHNKSNNISLNTIKVKADDSEISVVYDTTNETLCDNTPIAKHNNVLMNENNSDDDTLQPLNVSNFNVDDQHIQVVEWMITRESQKPYGGIIATDNDTTDYKITILMQLFLKSNVPNSYNTQSEGESDLDETIFSRGCTLILCQRSSIDDWIDSIEKNIQPGTFNVWVHYGKNRDISLHDLTQKDIVITTTTLVVAGFRKKENNPFYQINWNRIILDDVKLYNYKQQTSKALCQLLGNCHWVFSTPAIINNDDDDEAMYSLIKFINYKPLNIFENWKKWVKTNQTISMYEKLRHILYYDKKIVA